MPMNIFNKCSPIKYHSDGTHYLEIIRDLDTQYFLIVMQNIPREGLIL